MTKLKQIYQRFFRMGLLVVIIIPSILLSQDPPEEFQFSQSTLQAFYFFTDITINDESIELDDWVAAFKGGLCVGARQWDTSGFCSDPIYSDKISCEAAGICSDPQFNNNEYDCTDENGTWSGENWTWNQCNGGVCDVPAMGLDGATYTEGYMEIGDVPTFKIYDASSGNIFDATPSVEVGSWSVNGFSMNDLLEASEVIIGCTDNTACNYDLNATEPCTDCCLYIEDCAGECGGSAEDLGCG
ncbi:MAG: hypothetical protein HOM61_06760, partial [Candidatus Marinimicrobia bacterium]|nr:hypothetical protein [Candidatus Neomarinimicrobiota bacterium]